MLHLPEHTKLVLDEAYEQRSKEPVHAVTLPCTDRHPYREPVVVQLTRTGDQVIKCPLCGKTHLLTWQPINGHKWQK